jgi:hypothetical protein
LRAIESSYYQDLPLPAPVYDVGCGDGHFASLTFDQKIDVGLDPWHGPIHEAKKFGGYKSLVEADGANSLRTTLQVDSAIRCSSISRISTRCWQRLPVC